MSLIGIFHRYTYIFYGYSGISVVFRYFGDSCDPSRGHIFEVIIMKLAQNVCLDFYVKFGTGSLITYISWSSDFLKFYV